jgi:eukaryotic-like serine/threonine-protein kinase
MYCLKSGMAMSSFPMQNYLQNQLLVADHRYIIESVLDPGGMGIICLARDTQLDQQVVIKLLKEPLLNTSEVHRLFHKEVRLRSDFDSENIVKIFNSGTNSKGYPFYVMEYLLGESLEWKLQREKQFSSERAIRVAVQVCLAMEMIHTRSVANCEGLHLCPQNLKPSHIFLLSTAAGEQVKVLDCGITQKVRNYCRDSHSTNLMNLLQGSFHYSAPEQLELNEEIDHRADIYILGIILYEMLCGTDPFSLGFNSRVVSEVSWIHAHTVQTPSPLELQLGNDPTSSALSNIVYRCLQKKPGDRYDSLQALREEIEQIEISDRHPSAEMTENAPVMQALDAVDIAESDDQTVFQELTPASEYSLMRFAVPAHLSRDSYGLEDSTIAQPIPDSIGVNSLQYLDLPSHYPVEQIISPEPTPEVHHQKDETVLQYSDSAVHNPGGETILQQLNLVSDPEQDQTVHQFDINSNHQPSSLVKSENKGEKQPSTWYSRLGHTVRAIPRFVQRFLNPKKQSSPLRPPAQLPAAKIQSHSTDHETPPDSAHYQKLIRELDDCRLSYAKELARNGKFRDAIALARRITETSRSFKNAQTLIQNWERF